METHATKTPEAVTPAPPIVTQAMLAEYEDLCRQVRLLKVLRLCLTALLRCGAAVEEGPLTARLDEHTTCVCSWEKLDELLSPGVVAYLQSQVEPTAVTQLVVTPA